MKHHKYDCIRKTIGETCNILCGYAFDSKLFSTDETNIPLIRIRDISRGYTDTYYIGEYKPEYVVKNGDFLIGMDGEFKIQKWSGTDALLNQRVCKLYIKTENILLPTFLLYFMPKPLKKIEDQTPYVTVKHLSTKKLLDIEIPIPSIEEQERIIDELDCLSNIIDNKKKQLEELDKLAQAIFYDMFGDPTMNNKGWKTEKLGNICNIARGGSPRPISSYLTEGDNGINWIKIGDPDESSIYITKTKEKIKPEGVAKSRFVQKGDFILSNSMSFGRPYILKIDGCIHDGWLVIKDIYNTFNKLFLYYLLSSPHMYLEFKKLAVGGVVNNLNSELVRSVYVPIPDFSMQLQFAEKIESIEKQKDLIKKSLQEVETLFNSRMDYYFN